MNRADLPVIADALIALGHRLKAEGTDAWDLAQSWELGPQRVDTRGERGGGLAGNMSEATLREKRMERQQDAAAARMLERLRTAMNALDRERRAVGVTLDDLRRQDRPHHIDQCCVSCARDAGHVEPIHVGRYRLACRFCGEWRANHGEWPPLVVVRWRHRHPGKRVPVSIVEKAS